MRFLDIRAWLESEKSIEQQRAILNRLDAVFGVVMMSFTVFQVYQWQTGHASARGALILVGMMVMNLTLSQVLRRIPKHQVLLMIARTGILNQAIAAALVLEIDGPLFPFWLIYVVNAAGIGPALFSLKSNRLLILLQCINVANFVTVTEFLIPSPLGHGAVLKMTAMLIVTASISEVVIQILRSTLRQHVELGIKLEAGAKKDSEQQEFIQGFIDHFPGVAFAKNQSGEFTLANHTTKKILGDSIIGKTESQLAIGQVFNPLSAIDQQRLESGASVFTEEELFHNGRASFFATTRFQLFQDGSPIEECAIGVDITEQRIAEKDFEQSKANMISASKMSALGEMAGGIAHEINNPLAIILGKSQRIFESSDNETLDHETIEKDAAKIMQITERIAKITGALRSFARDDNNAPFAKIKVEDICSETLALCSERFRNRGIRVIDGFASAASGTSELIVDCRGAEISQVLLHLLNNAYDAVQQRPNPWVRIAITDAGEFVDISVMDSGDGIPLGQREKIFQPFFTTKPIGQATGLGLSIVDGIIGAHHGRLWLDTNAACTSFMIRLPKIQSSNTSGKKTTLRVTA